MKAAALLVSACLLSPAWAGDEPKCNDGGSMVEMAACARDDFNAADVELNRVYRELLTAGASEPRFIANLRAAQKAWIKFRDAELDAKFACEDENNRICWGTMLTLDWPAYKTSLTRERTQQLDKLLADRFPNRAKKKPTQ